MQSENPGYEVDRRIAEVISELVDAFSSYDVLGSLEVVRMATLPFVHADAPPLSAGTQSGPAVAEILSVAVLSASRAPAVEGEFKQVDQALCRLVSERLIPLAMNFLDLATVRDVVAAQRIDDMAQIAAAVRGNARWVRGTSYPEMQDETLRGLFGLQRVDAALRATTGFGVGDAILVLSSCHEIQMRQYNNRAEGIAAAFDSVDLVSSTAPSEEAKGRVSRAFIALFNPSAEDAGVSVESIAEHTGLSVDTVSAVGEFFAAHQAVEGADPLRSHIDGNSPLRAHPLFMRDNLLLVVHPALYADAVKAAFEDTLKKSAHWETYSNHRGSYLEGRISSILSNLLPGVVEHSSIEYFVPATESEAQGHPSSYTKLVEGDHLFVIDDVALIVEDKAIPLSDRSRTGEINPLRRNLAAAITKGAEQASRAKTRIVEDKGLRLRSGEWLDLRDVREIHTIVTSLDDLAGIATTTARLVGAGLLDEDNLPWTVSLHDFELISELVERPAEFLLYVRRRTDPRATEMYLAVDELDLFLLFLRTGLFVEPDPEIVAQKMPWLGRPRPADVRRYRKQVPALVTSQTDALDAWHFSLHPPAGVPERGVAPKPRMTTSPLSPLVDWLMEQRAFGWLSIGAALLEGSTGAQQVIAEYPSRLADKPAADGSPRSLAIPWGLSKEDGWLLVWMTRPPARNPEAVLRHAQTYMIAKKAQLGFRRGVAFVYDEAAREYVAVSYDSGQATPDADLLEELVASLRPAEDVVTQAQVTRRLRSSK